MSEPKTVTAYTDGAWLGPSAWPTTTAFTAAT